MMEKKLMQKRGKLLIMEPNRILFVIYIPYFGYLPKRMAELESRAKLDKVDQVTITPYTYQEILHGLRADSVHLIQLHPDNSVDEKNTHDYFNSLEELQHLVESIKTHNNI